MKKDIARIKEAQEISLDNAAEAAGVPIDQEYVNSKVTNFVTKYNEDADQHSSLVAKNREELLAIHKETMDAKNAVISHKEDIKNLAGSISQKFSRNSSEQEEALRTIKDTPEFSEFDQADEYIDTINLLDHSQNNVDKAVAKMDEKIITLNLEREGKLRQDNPMLKKLRRKAVIGEFLNSSSASDKEEVYYQALQAEKERVGFVGASAVDFPEDAARINAHKAEVNDIRYKQNQMRNAYQDNLHRLNYDGHRVQYNGAEELIRAAPSTGTYQELKYRNKLREFNRKKESYTEIASREYNVEKATAQFRAEVTADAPFQEDKFKEFKKNVYDKSSEAQKLTAELSEKRAQLHLTPQYRAGLEEQAFELVRTSMAVNYTRANTLFDQKKKLDALAEKTMGENRLKALMNNGISKETQKSLKAQKQSSPTHYRTNLANNK